MPIHAVCPQCKAAYDLVDDQRGKKVRCKKCENVFVAGAAPAPKREEAVLDVEAVGRSSRAAPKKDTTPPPRKASDRGRDDDDRDERRRPAPRKKGGGLGAVLVVGGLAVLALIILVGGVGLIVALRWYTKEDDKVVNPQIAGGWNPGNQFNPPQNGGRPGDQPQVNNNPPEDNAAVREPEVKDPPAEENLSGKTVPGANGQLAQAVLLKVKRATAFIHVTMPDGGQASGSGFFGVEPKVLLTNAHVVGMLHAENTKPKNIEVTLDKGEPTERRFAARVVGVDRDSDLAVLKVYYLPDQTEGTIPSPLDVKPAADLAETQQLYVFGFPLGERLGKEISIRPTSVASLRKDGQGLLERVQVNGGMDPGNSGGPVVDANGDVVGVAVSGIVGTTINFAIPGERVRYLLQGRVREPMGLGEAFYKESKLVMPVTIQMVDPLSRIKEVGLDVWTGDDKKPRPASAGEAPKPLPGDSARVAAKLSYEKGTAKGEVVLPALPQGKVYYIQPSWKTGDKVQWGKGSVHAVHPVELKSAQLTLQQQMGERNLTVKIDHFYRLSVSEQGDLSLTVDINAKLKENTTGIDPRRGATVALQYSSFAIDGKADKGPLPPDYRRDLDRLRTHTGRATSTFLQDAEGNLSQFQPDLSKVQADARQEVGEGHEQIQQAIDALAVKMPNKETKPGETWQAQRGVPIGPPGKYQKGTVNLTYTFSGTRKNDAGREEAVISFEGDVHGADRRAQEGVSGRATGSAVVDIGTGQVTRAHATIHVDVTNTAGIKITDTVALRLERPLP